MLLRHRWAALAVLPLLLAGCKRAPEAGDVVVFAAASLGPVVDSLATQFERQTGSTVTVSLGASSTLARQIEAGAPAHVFLSAHPDWVDYLTVREHVRGEAVPVASNRLVAIGRRGAALSVVHRPADLIAVERLALGDPAHVPVGVYARTAMEMSGVWLGVDEAVIPLPDARAAVAAVERGAAQAAVVYASDAQRAMAGPARDSLRILFRWPEAEQPPIEYVGALVELTASAEAFLAFLREVEQEDVWGAFGFEPPLVGVPDEAP